ncbi:hypothetical protein GOODEAATRI_013509 [Goodea atripinnis]|uniref:Zona pellucida glycoprotein 3 n=1 Tax=Goodea atripinnis TaxID=208336 RepID=A0ABV0NW15_9TELE
MSWMTSSVHKYCNSGGRESTLFEVQCEVQSVMIWGSMSSAAVSPLGFLKSNQCSHVPGHFRALHAFSSNQLCKDTDFIFKQDLIVAHTAKGNKSFSDHVTCYCQVDLTPHSECEYCQEEDESPKPIMQMT